MYSIYINLQLIRFDELTPRKENLNGTRAVRVRRKNPVYAPIFPLSPATGVENFLIDVLSPIPDSAIPRPGRSHR